MFLGEVSVPIWNPNMDDGFRVSQTIFFLSFIFFIVSVLMNLLNALAVAEVREMFENVKVETLNSLLTNVSYWENMLHGEPNHCFKWNSLFFFPNKAKRSHIIWGLHESYKHDM